MDLTETNSDTLRRIADHLQREITEMDILILDAKKQKMAAAVRLDEVHTEIKRRHRCAA